MKTISLGLKCWVSWVGIHAMSASQEGQEEQQGIIFQSQEEGEDQGQQGEEEEIQELQLQA